MNKFMIAIIASCTMLMGTSAFATTPSKEEQCKKLKHFHNVIYASKHFCFKDPEAIAEFGNENCNTVRPRFSEKEQQRLDEIKIRQKELQCN